MRPLAIPASGCWCGLGGLLAAFVLVLATDLSAAAEAGFQPARSAAAMFDRGADDLPGTVRTNPDEEPSDDPQSTMMSPDETFFERGGASWYGIALHLRRTASGERFNMNAMTAAHRTLPFGTKVCVRSLVTGREVLVRINDRGPHAQGRVIDLSRAAAAALDLLGQGIKEVALSLPELTGRPCGQ